MFHKNEENLEFIMISEAQRAIGDTKQKDKIEREEKKVKESLIERLGKHHFVEQVRYTKLENFIKSKISVAEARDYVLLEEFKITVPFDIDIELKYKDVFYRQEYKDINKKHNPYMEHYIRIEKDVKKGYSQATIQTCPFTVVDIDDFMFGNPHYRPADTK